MTEDTKAQAMLMYRWGCSCAGISRELKEDPIAVRSYEIQRRARSGRAEALRRFGFVDKTALILKSRPKC